MSSIALGLEKIQVGSPVLSVSTLATACWPSRRIIVFRRRDHQSTPSLPLLHSTWPLTSFAASAAVMSKPHCTFFPSPSRERASLYTCCSTSVPELIFRPVRLLNGACESNVFVVLSTK